MSLLKKVIGLTDTIKEYPGGFDSIKRKILEWFESNDNNCEAVNFFMAGILRPDKENPKLWMNPKLIDVSAIRDVDDNKIFGIDLATGKTVFFFLDPYSGCNWHHPCYYIAVPVSGPLRCVEHDIFPSDLIDSDMYCVTDRIASVN